MDPETNASPDDTNFATRKIMGLPVIVWVGIVALGAYFIISRRSQSAGSPSTSGGGGTATEGNTRLDKGAVTVTITQTNPQPKPPVTKRRPVVGTHPNIPPRTRGAPHPSKKPGVHKTTGPGPNPGGRVTNPGVPNRNTVPVPEKKKKKK